MKKAIVVDDDKNWINRIDKLLSSLDFTVKTYERYSETLSLTLQNDDYDLFITDIRLDHNNIDKKEGLELARIVHDRNPNVPIILISGFNEDCRLIRDLFINLNIDDILIKQDWKNEIFIHSVHRSFNNRSKSNKLNKDIKYKAGIVTALYSCEFEEIIKIIENVHNINDPGFLMRTGKIKNTNLNVVAAHQHNMGMIDTGILTSKIINEYKPEYIIMAGVCGGRKSKGLKIGDIIIPKKVFYYQIGKITESGFKYYLNAESITGNYLQLAENSQTVICDKIETKSGRKGHGITAYFQSIASGNVVVNKKGYFEGEIAKYDEQVVGVDMESYGLIRACKLINNGFTKPLIIKSVMDFTENKADKDKNFAAFTSAQFIKYLFQDVLSK